MQQQQEEEAERRIREQEMTEQERYEEYIQTPEYIARQEALTEWLEEQEQERIAALYAAWDSSAVEAVRAQNAALVVPENDKNWRQVILDPVAEFIAGAWYQAIIVNNLNPLMAIAPAPESVKNGWSAGWSALEGDSPAFIIGRIVGGVLGALQGIWEITSGVATATGGTLVSCGTGILCVGGGATAIAVGTALVVHGSVVLASASTHGVGMLVHNANNPLQIRGNGGGSNLPPNPEKGFFGSNKQNTSKNSKELYKNMGEPERLNGYQAHHIVPSFSQRPAAIKARKILEEFGIDINEAGNGVMIPGKINRKLNKPGYEDAVLNILENAQKKGASQADVLELLQDIGEQIKNTGTFP